MRATIALLALAVLPACDGGSSPPSETTFRVTVEHVGPEYSLLDSGAFTFITETYEQGPLHSGDAHEVTFTAPPGARVIFATMLAQSNDWFFAPDPSGIALYDESGAPIEGDVTDQVFLWDTGTEVNQPIAEGPDQPGIGGKETGDADPNDTVRKVTAQELAVPVADMLKATITSEGDNRFTLRLENVSDDTTITLSDGTTTTEAVIAPGLWAVFFEGQPLFTEGQADWGLGLEGLAEDGDARALADYLASETGINTPFSPLVWAVHESGEPLFVPDEASPDNGLEALAEEGDPAALAASLDAMTGVASSGTVDTPVGASEPGPLKRGESYTFTVSAAPGAHLSLASMLGESNDTFVGFGAEGLALFYALGEPKTGVIESELVFWDAGTEANEYPGAGPHQAPRQSAPGEGGAGEGKVQAVADTSQAAWYPDPSVLLKVTIELGE